MKTTNPLWQLPINVRNFTENQEVIKSDGITMKQPNESKPVMSPLFVNRDKIKNLHRHIERPLTKEVNLPHPYYPVHQPSKATMNQRPIQHRYHPQVKKPFGQNEFAAPAFKPAETILINQIAEPPVFIENFQPAQEQHDGYYPNPSYGTLSPVFFTTTELPVKSNVESPHTYYYLGNKIWYIPLYFAIAFVAFYGYIIIRNVVWRAINYPFGRDIKSNDIMDLTIKILSSIQIAAEIPIYHVSKEEIFKFHKLNKPSSNFMLSSLNRHSQRVKPIPNVYHFQALNDRLESPPMLLISDNNLTFNNQSGTLQPFLITPISKLPLDKNKFHMYYQLGSKFWYFPLYYSFAFVIYTSYLLIRTVALRLFNFSTGLQQSILH